MAYSTHKIVMETEVMTQQNLSAMSAKNIILVPAGLKGNRDAATATSLGIIPKTAKTTGR